MRMKSKFRMATLVLLRAANVGGGLLVNSSSARFARMMMSAF